VLAAVPAGIDTVIGEDKAENVVTGVGPAGDHVKVYWLGVPVDPVYA
jgi:hypothetical protein